jgi:hypothetical protein
MLKSHLNADILILTESGVGGNAKIITYADIILTSLNQ